MTYLMDTFGVEVSLNGLAHDEPLVRSHQSLVDHYVFHVNKFQEGMPQYLSPFEQKHHLREAELAWKKLVAEGKDSVPQYGFLHVLMAMEYVFHGPPLPSAAASVDHGGSSGTEFEGSDLFVAPDVLLQRARTALPVMNERERLLFKATELWLKGDLYGAVDVHRTIARKYPQDLTSIFLAYNHYIVLFDMVKLEQLLRDTVMNMPGFNYWPFRYFVYGMMCFVLEQRFDFVQAEHFGGLALEGDHLLHATHVKRSSHDSMASRSEQHRVYPWTHHSMCHVYHSTGRLKEGVEFMERHSADWSRCRGGFLDHHNRWHLALMYLELGEMEKMKEIYDSKIWLSKIDKTEENAAMKMDAGYITAWRNDFTVLSDAIGMLIRAQLKNHIGEIKKSTATMRDAWIEEQWKHVTEIAQLKWAQKQHISPFFDIHFVYVLARTGRYHCDQLLEQVKQHVRDQGEQIPNYMKLLWIEVFLPLARAIFYYASEDYKQSYAAFQRLFDTGTESPSSIRDHTEDQRSNTKFTTLQRHTCLIGGSHAQREFLELIYADVLGHLGKWDDLQPIVQHRVDQFSQRPVCTTFKLQQLLVLHSTP